MIRLLPPSLRAQGHYSRGIKARVAEVVVGLNMLLIDIATQVALGAVVQPAHVPRYFRVVLQLLLVTLEDCRVDHVEPD